MLLGAAYGLTGHLADLLTVVSGLNNQGLSNGNPLWKFVLGFNHETGGIYDAADWARIYPTLDAGGQVTEATLSLERAMIAERLRSLRGRCSGSFSAKFGISGWPTLCPGPWQPSPSQTGGDCGP